LNERFAQRNNIEPRVEISDLRKLEAELERRGLLKGDRSTLFERLQAGDIAAACRAIKLPQYAERWVQIKSLVSPRVETRSPAQVLARRAQALPRLGARLEPRRRLGR
jgi:hypothetical protein